MENTTPIESEEVKAIRLKSQFDSYIVWKSLPYFLKRMTGDELREKAGIEDEALTELLALKNQAAFAAYFKLSPDTLSDWNKIIDDNDLLKETKKWARKLTKSMVLSGYNHFLKKGNPALLKLWLQYIEGWEEKTQVAVDYKGVAVVEVTRKINDNAPSGEAGKLETS